MSRERIEMIEFIRQIPGPIFIWFFLAFSLLCIVLTMLLTDADGSARHAPVDESGLDPVAVAVLQGGVDSVIRSRVFSLMNRGLVVIENGKKKASIRAASKADTRGLSAIDTEILAFLSIERTTEALFTDEEFRARVEAHLADVRAGLELRNLVKNEAQQARVVKITLLFGALVASLGGLKLYLGVMRAKPIAFLVIVFIVSEAILFLILRKRKHLTRLGRVYLKDLRERFRWTRKRKTLPEGVDPALLVALYGAGHLYVSSLYPQYTEAFRRNASGGSGCSGGCGGGSSSGSSDGGSGGCGGCGGD